jgi:IrrE N-terminal-like domain
MAAPGSDLRRLEKAEHTLFGGILYGVEGRQIELQAQFFADASTDSWDIDISGMAGAAVKEANLFAAELLMPERILKADLAMIEQLDVEDEAFLGRLAGKYEVSVQALSFRVANLAS